MLHDPQVLKYEADSCSLDLLRSLVQACRALGFPQSLSTLHHVSTTSHLILRNSSCSPSAMGAKVTLRGVVDGGSYFCLSCPLAGSTQAAGPY